MKISAARSNEHLAAYFTGFKDGLPPAGLYHRILREIEYPLLTAALAATRGNQIRAADIPGSQPQHFAEKIRDLDIQVFRGQLIRPAIWSLRRGFVAIWQHCCIKASVHKRG